MMKHGDYELDQYTDNDIDYIVNLLRFLWDGNVESNREYFIWKHRKNPFQKNSVGIVARFNNEIVGFRGFSETQWKLNNTIIKMLSPSDAIVHPKHRRKALFSQMNELAMELYRDDYEFFLNLSSNQYSTPGYLKLGWKPIQSSQKHYVRNVNIFRLVRDRIMSNDREAFTLGRFGSIEVANRLHFSDISSLIKEDSSSRNRMFLNKTAKFYRWKMSCGKRNYITIYHHSESKIDAYLLISFGNYEAHIVDYGGQENSLGISAIIDFILRKMRFNLISVLNLTLPSNLRRILKKRHFYRYEIIEKMRKKDTFDLPTLIRPIKKDYNEDDWFLDRVDTRDISNWKILGICSA